ncbi:MAG: hypothetical protein V4458_13185 [Pseudomonadota bacterium]
MLTAADAIIYFTIPLLFPTPQQIQQFATDDVFSTDPLKSAEVQRGVDGKLSGGFVYSDIRQNYALIGDSDSIEFFSTWHETSQANRVTYTANAVITLPSRGKKWTMTKGFLTGFQPIPDAKKILQPVRFTIEWESMSPSAT